MRKNSRIRKINLLILASGVLALLLIGLILIFDDAGKKHPDEYLNELIYGTPTPELPLEFDEPTATPIPPEIIDELTADVIVKYILQFVLEKDYPYGSLASGTKIESGSLAGIAGLKEKGKEITIHEVGPGDIGTFGNYECVCVGVDEDGNAIFAYASPYASEYLPQGGIYLGYALEQNDSLYHGMYPLPMESYYDCAEGEVSISTAEEKAALYENTVSEFVDALYEAGRMFSTSNVEKVMTMIPEDVMLEHNVKFVPDELLNFLNAFTMYAKADSIGATFCFREKELYSVPSGLYIKAELVSLEKENFLECAGLWNLTVSETSLIPFEDYKLYDYIGRGFSKAQETVYIYDEEGNLIGYEMVDVVEPGTVVEDEEGNRTYIGDGYNMHLEEGEGILEEGQTIVDFGNMQYLLIGNDGVAYNVDMSQYAEYDEALINHILKMRLKEINESLMQE